MIFRLKILALCAIVGGIFLSVSGFKAKALRKSLDDYGKTVAGFLISGESSSGRSSSQKIIVEYKTEDERVMSKEFSLTKAYFESITDSESNSFTADSVEVCYLPKDPDQAIVVDGSPDTSSLAFGGIGVAVVGLLGALYLFFGRKG